MAPKMKSRQKASQEYWEEREKEALKQTRLTEEQFAAEIEKIYGDMRREVNSRISNWYVRYADESGIDIAEAKKRVSKLDMEEYAELARKYVELARKEETKAQAFTDEANEQMKLYNLTMKVNRLENLKAQIGLELCGGFSQLEKKYGTFLTEQMMEEFDRQSGILGMTTQRPEAVRRQIEAVVNGSFHNATFSERLWNQQDALKGELDRLLSRALIQGLNPRAVAPELRKKFGASEMAADLLMITELCRVQTEAQKLAFQEYGYEEYTFICNGGACEACEGLSGKHFKVRDMQPGLNAPPMHPRCRCSTAAYMDREAFEKWLEERNNFKKEELPLFKDNYQKYKSPSKTQTLTERQKMAEDADNVVSQFTKRASKWSGSIVYDKNNPYAKLPNCDISLAPDTTFDIAIHENLHSRSISHYPDEYSKFKASEEASVQMMTELICKKLGIIPTPSQYQRWIDNLKKINSKAGLYTSEDDFIKELYEKDPRDRYSWLFKNVHDKIDSSATLQEQYEIGLLLQEFEPIK